MNLEQEVWMQRECAEDALRELERAQAALGAWQVATVCGWLLVGVLLFARA